MHLAQLLVFEGVVFPQAHHQCRVIETVQRTTEMKFLTKKNEALKKSGLQVRSCMHIIAVPEIVQCNSEVRDYSLDHGNLARGSE